MKTVSLDFEQHLEEELTTLATCWHIARRDGIEFFFTDHDRDLVVDGDTYLSAIGYSRTAISNDMTLSVDNLDVMGFLDNETITAEDLRAGAYDFAEVHCFSVNWADLTMGILKQRRGWLGEVTLGENGVFKAELRGLTQALSQKIGEVYSPECRADLGDSRCKVPIQPAEILRQTAYTVGQFVRVLTAPNSAGSGQDQYENRIYEVTTAGTTGVTEPTYDTTPGATTLDGDEPARGIFNFTGQPANAQTFTVGGKVYTLQTVLTNVDGHVLIGATFQDTVANILAATTLGPGAGTTYAALTTAHPTVTFSFIDATHIGLEAITPGSAGNLIGTTENMNNAFFDDNTLEGGWDGAIFTTRQAWTRHAEVVAVGQRASTVFNFTGIPTNGQQFTIGSKTYTMQTVLTNVNGNILIGIDAAATQANVLAALQLGSGAGTVYAASTTAHPQIDAYQVTAATSIRIDAKVGGTPGNLIATTENLANAAFTGTLLAGGTDDRFTLYIDVEDARADDDWFDGGAFIFESGANAGRLIEMKTWDAETKRVQLFLPSPYPVEVGTTARVYPGCDKRLETCIDKFNNVLNFRGEPFIPGQDDILKYPDAK